MTNYSDTIRKIVNNSKIKEQKSPSNPPPDVEVRQTRDEKSVEVTVHYYFNINKRDALKLQNTSGSDTEEVLSDIIRKNMLSSGGTSEETCVLLELETGESKKIIFDRTRFEKASFDPKKRLLRCTTEKKSLDLKDVNKTSGMLKKTSLEIPRADVDNFSLPEIRVSNLKLTAKVLNAPASTSMRQLKKESVSKITIKQPRLSLVPVETIETNTHSSAEGHGVSYPLVSDIYVECNSGECSGYFFLNCGRIFLDEFSNKKNTNTRPKSYSVELFKRRKSQALDVKKVEELNKLTLDNPGDGLDLYSFTHPLEDGEYEYYIRLRTKDESLKETLQVLNQVSSVNSTIDSDTDNFHKLPANLEKIQNAVVDLKKISGTFTSTISDSVISSYGNTVEPISLTLEIQEYMRNVSQALMSSYDLYRDDNGEIKANKDNNILQEITLGSTKNIKNSTQNFFNKEHTVAEISNVLSVASEYVDTKQSFSIKYNKTVLDNTSGESEDYFLSRALEHAKKTNMEKKYSIKLSLLKKHKTSYRHGAPLLRNYHWVPYAAEDAPSSLLIRAVVFCSDGTLHEEYFTVRS